MRRDLAHLSRRYTLGLVLVAVLSIVGQALVQGAQARHSEDARVINVAGRQRMLSQRLVKAALAVAGAFGSGDAHGEYRDEIYTVLSEWTRSHRGLTHGDGQLGLRPTDSAAIIARYAGIEDSFTGMEEAARRFLRFDREGDTPGVGEALQRLLALEPVFLAGMNDIVLQFQREAEARVTGVRRIEMGLLVLVLVTLLLEGMFVFRPAVQALIRDLRERRRLEREILEISERERERIGQDIHDDLCQQLAGIRLVAESLAVRAARGTPADVTSIKALSDLSDRALSVASGVARGMYITALAERGLASALAELASEIAARTALACTHDLRVDDAHLPREIGLQMYRIAQEAMGNALKHAAARSVHVLLARDGDDVVMTVTDDGVGIARAPGRRSGMGLHIMQYRARMIGATLDVDGAGSAGRRGTRVTCRLRRPRDA